ncbi:ribosome modulation factor [Methylobacterium haplocladii]|uniref:Uncharacterized protein n=1 Tax=Methylobacterium haplocladii TaxID=1176176 RepID=A0A512IPJ9_9HYPH|nr:hypothetical protein [Methylobacterium haplocladii]GEO99568.1 hypothetical protein MHA02_19560 [Methylobacterium haplocladii]GJD85860.1 hypothetical protein HPGCJGGD_3754 [Methylobacterium haplocladii]GLS58544.1 hypothetical protein GCM10007887_12080 [Methylobacterium haplocladii]
MKTFSTSDAKGTETTLRPPRLSQAVPRKPNDMDTNRQQGRDPVSEGAHARAAGWPKDANPYPAGSIERVAWFEGYDGLPLDGDVPPSLGGNGR